ncbi:hypothetical protein PIB30_076726 [Stylosanthes scabra]|uniref:Uncharacterized protein n=1 Tax=Stylosanthes scabra TaxID=79078 RepID=A0ABU6UP46_9FABA|nr:hypothetical protein [Stylosanthes scabra]
MWPIEVRNIGCMCLDARWRDGNRVNALTLAFRVLSNVLRGFVKGFESTRTILESIRNPPETDGHRDGGKVRCLSPVFLLVVWMNPSEPLRDGRRWQERDDPSVSYRTRLGWPYNRSNELIGRRDRHASCAFV